MANYEEFKAKVQNLIQEMQDAVSKNLELGEATLVIYKEKKKIKEIINILNNKGFTNDEVVFLKSDGYIRQIKEKFEEKIEELNTLQLLDESIENLERDNLGDNDQINNSKILLKKLEILSQMNPELKYKTKDGDHFGKQVKFFLNKESITPSEAIPALQELVDKYDTPLLGA